MEYDDILFAAWMDDLGVFWGYRPQDPAQLERWDHIPYTIARTRELLAAWGFPAEKWKRLRRSSVPTSRRTSRTEWKQFCCGTQTFWSSWAQSGLCER